MTRINTGAVAARARPSTPLASNISREGDPPCKTAVRCCCPPSPSAWPPRPPGLALAQAAAAPASGESRQAERLFDAIMAKQLRQSPETATSLASTSANWPGPRPNWPTARGPPSPRASLRPRQQLADLRAIDRKALTGMDVVNYDTVEFTLAVQDEGNEKFHLCRRRFRARPMCSAS